MKKTAVALIFVSLMAIVVVTTAQHGVAQYYGAVRINADGTIDPADAPIQGVGNTYTLTGDVGGIGVYRSNIILDGNGHTLPGKVSSVDSLGNNVTALNAGGVFLKNVRNITVENLIIKDCQTGIYLDRCFTVTVSGNIITGTHVPVPQAQATGGIYVWAGGSHNITGNQLTNTYNGIYLGYNSRQNTITRNNITNSGPRGIVSWSVSDNVIYCNNLVDNEVQASVNGDSVNFWDNGSVGNYWSDYNGTDANGDGVGDTPYVIDVNNQDNYPLMYPWGAPCVSLLSLKNSTYVGGFPLNFTVSKPAMWMGYSLDGQENVTVTGNVTLSGLSSGLHNVTVYAKDEFANIGASETVTFTIEEPFPTILVIAVSGASIAAIGAGLIVYFKKRRR